MSIVRYTGNDLNQKQQYTATIGSPVANTTLLEITCNGKQFTYLCATAVAATEAESLAQAIAQASDIKEFLDFQAESDGADLLLTSNNAGVPFTISSASVVSGGGTFSGSVTTANSGSGVWSSADNWTSTPSNSDDLVLDIPNLSIKYLLTGITATINSLTVRGTFNRELGNAIVNPLGYPEYRGCYCFTKAPTITIGLGDGPGPQRCYINYEGGAACNATIYKTGAPLDAYPACLLKHTAGGGNSFGNIRVVDGSVGIALLPEEVSTVTVLHVGGEDGRPSVFAGVGATVTTFKAESGETILTTSPTNSTITGGATVTIGNGGNATSINLDSGTLYFGGNGAASVITDLTVGEAGTLDLSVGLGNVTVTNGIVIYAGARIVDPLGRLVTGTVFKPQNGVLSDFTFQGPPGKTWTMS